MYKPLHGPGSGLIESAPTRSGRHRAPKSTPAPAPARKTPTRRVLGALTSVAALVAGVIAVTATTAAADPATQTVFVDASFTGMTTGAEWLRPAAPTGRTNAACLTASTNTAQTPIPGCSGGSADPDGSGMLSLTAASGNQVGGVGSTISVPISKGMDIVFDSYQWGGTSADGIAFYLAATDPFNPSVPDHIGYWGGSLGYGRYQTTPGLAYGYLGFGLDVYGNFLNSDVGGDLCTGTPGPTAGAVGVRGPGNGTTGYCVLNHSAGGVALHANTRADSKAQVEILINPSDITSTATSGSGLTVDPKSYKIVVAPHSGSPVTLAGALPKMTDSEYSGLYPSSWYDATTGLPYKLTFGWVGSTGGATDNHEVSTLKTETVNGAVPELTASVSGDTSVASGDSGTFAVTPTVTAGGGSEEADVRATVTFPAGVTPAAYSGTDWSCTLSGQTQTCTYHPVSPIDPGTALPKLELPYTGGSVGSGNISYTVASVDTLAVTGTYGVTTTAAVTTTSASDLSTTVGATPTLSATVTTAVGTVTGGTVTFTDTTTGTVLCTASVSAGAASCTSSAVRISVGDHTVTAEYSGTANYVASDTSVTMTVGKGTPSLTASATLASIEYGSTSTLAVTGMPADATGTVTFTDASSAELCTATLPTTSCSTASGLEVDAYAVTATYSGDSNYNDTTAAVSLDVTKATPTITAQVADPSLPFADTTTLSVTGLPPTGTGTVTFTEGGVTLCTATIVTPGTAACDLGVLLDAGAHTVTATYSGDEHYTTATATAPLTVTPVTPTLVTTAAPTTVSYPGTATLAVTGLPTGATGTVTFDDGAGTTLCTATLPATSCQTASGLNAGAYPVHATYVSGDGNVIDATSAPADQATLTVAKGSTTLTLAVSPSAPKAGDPVTFTAGGVGDRSGTVTVTRDGGIPVCSFTAPGQTSCSVSSLPAGSHTFTAQYAGDGNHSPASATASLVVNKVTVTLSATGGSVPYGTAATLSAKGLPAGATGTVTFTANGKTLCTATVTAGAAACQTSASLAGGSYGVAASYSGDGTYLAASAATTLTVTRAESPITVPPPSAPVPFGDGVPLNAGLPPGATGTVTFIDDDGAVLCTAVLPKTTCALPPGLKPGKHVITAQYSGDASHAPSSTTTTVTVADPDSVVEENVVSGQSKTVPIPQGTLGKLTIVGPPGHGTARIVNGQIVYVPEPGFSGTDEIYYILVLGENNVVRGMLRMTVAHEALANTGVDVRPYLNLAGLLLSMGVLALYFGQRRERRGLHC